MTKPFVGQPVHYRSHGSADGTYASECRAAIIAGIPKRTRSSLSKGEDIFVINPEGIFFKRCLQDEEGKAGGTWHLPEIVEEEVEPAKKRTPLVALI